MSKKLEEYVVTIPDFPEPGIMFRDITSVIQDPDGLKLAVDGLVGLLKDTEYSKQAAGLVFIAATPFAGSVLPLSIILRGEDRKSVV